MSLRWSLSPPRFHPHGLVLHQRPRALVSETLSQELPSRAVLVLWGHLVPRAPESKWDGFRPSEDSRVREKRGRCRARDAKRSRGGRGRCRRGEAGRTGGTDGDSGEWGAGRGPGRGGEETVTAAGESVCGVRASPNSSQVTVPGEDTKNHPPCPCSTCQTHRRNDTLRGHVSLCGMRAIFPSGQRSALCSCHSGHLGTSGLKLHPRACHRPHLAPPAGPSPVW